MIETTMDWLPGRQLPSSISPADGHGPMVAGWKNAAGPLARAVAVTALFAAALGCESGRNTNDVTGSSDVDGPLSICKYGYVVTNAAGKGIGEECNDASECEFGVCIKPGDDGNPTSGSEVINTNFGFCTRGCDCDNDTSSRLSDAEKPNFVCYVGPNGSQGKLKYVLPRCTSVSTCASFASGWSDCGLPGGHGTQKACLSP